VNRYLTVCLHSMCQHRDVFGTNVTAPLPRPAMRTRPPRGSICNTLASMKRRWNIPIWTGFAFVVAALVSYIPLFVPFPVTRDVPWVNDLLFLVGGFLLAVGIMRAFRDPEHYRGKISGSILAGLSLILFGFFVFGIAYAAKQIPSPESALRPGSTAPPFTLVDAAGRQVSSSDLLKSHRALVLVFYRGYW
jgi:hypothetical protein